jgi:hypothetical protein
LGRGLTPPSCRTCSAHIVASPSTPGSAWGMRPKRLSRRVPTGDIFPRLGSGHAGLARKPQLSRS